MTEDQAQQHLDQAVADYLHAAGWDDGLVTTGWVLVAAQTGFDGDGTQRAAYPLVYQGGQQPPHITIGLLRIAQDAIGHIQPADD